MNLKNFAELFAIHSEIGFDGNLARLVEATNNISPNGSKYNIRAIDKDIILQSPQRAKDFVASAEYSTLKSELDQMTIAL